MAWGTSGRYLLQPSARLPLLLPKAMQEQIHLSWVPAFPVWKPGITTSTSHAQPVSTRSPFCHWNGNSVYLNHIHPRTCQAVQRRLNRMCRIISGGLAAWQRASAEMARNTRGVVVWGDKLYAPVGSALDSVMSKDDRFSLPSYPIVLVMWSKIIVILPYMNFPTAFVQWLMSMNMDVDGWENKGWMLILCNRTVVPELHFQRQTR